MGIRGRGQACPARAAETKATVILLDTHVLVWLNRSPEKLSRDARRAISRAAASNGLAFSSISLWELAMFVQGGRLRFKTGTTRDFLEAMVQTPALSILEITPEIAVLATQFPSAFPKDPADRIIGATARSRGVPLVTSDERIRESPSLQTIW